MVNFPMRFTEKKKINHKHPAPPISGERDVCVLVYFIFRASDCPTEAARIAAVQALVITETSKNSSLLFWQPVPKAVATAFTGHRPEMVYIYLHNIFYRLK